jgi:3-dehydroquinate synthase
VNSEKIQIRGPGFCYDVLVGVGLIARAGKLARATVRGHRAAVITDSMVPRKLVDDTVASFVSADFQVTKIVIPAGEKSKSLREVERICGEMSGIDRSSAVVGIGGGVVGDLSGFVAAIFHRGIPHVQIPTTLLAMVDSAIGGKTGVNLAAGKNLAGAIHHPALVIADVDALATLPERELRHGCAEIVKHAIIRDAEMFHELSSRVLSASGFLNFARDDKLIARNIRIKATIVSADDRDLSGERALLNFGHTVGHGIERASDFSIPHGECVSVGIVAACEISVRRAGLPVAQRDEVIRLLRQIGLLTRLPGGLAPEEVLKAIARDKKFERGDVRFVVTPQIGQAYLSRDITMNDIENALTAL